MENQDLDMCCLAVAFKFAAFLWLFIISKDTCNNFKLVEDQLIFNGISLDIGLYASEDNKLNQHKY